MSLQLASVGVALLLAIFAGAQVAVIRRQWALSELQVIHELRDQWNEVQDEWSGLLLMGGHFYLNASEEVLEKYPVLAHEDFGEYLRLVHFNKSSSWDEIESSLSSEEVDLVGWGSPLNFPEPLYRLPLGVLATVSAYVLRGRISVGVAYEVFGSHLTRNSGTIRYVTDVAPQSTYYLNNYPGIRRRILILIDLMWAEAARLEDLNPGEARTAAEVKRESSSGVRNRQRLRVEARRLGGIVTALRLDRHLVFAEVTRTGIRGVLARFQRWLAGLAPRAEGELFPRRDPWH